MRGITHGAAGIFLGALAGSLGGGMVWGAVAGGVFAVLPDIDHPGSIAGRACRPIGVYLEERWGHRDSPTHTLLFVLAAPVLFAAAWRLFEHPVAPFAAAMLGGISHIALDAATRSGVRPWRYLFFLPGEKRRKLYRWRLETGESPVEWVLTAVFFLATVALVSLKFGRI